MNKRFLYLYIFLLIFAIPLKAQRHELGVQLGMSNLVGDIGRNNYILQQPITDNFSQLGLPFYGGIAYRFNFNPYQTIRLNLGYSHIQFADKYAKEYYRYNRKLFGTNSIFEGDIVFEYNFFPVNEEQKGMLSPYVFGGAGFLYAYVNKNSRKFIFTTPFGIGLKYKFNYDWALSGSFTFRPTNSDDIDYSAMNGIGNLNSKDWVNTTAIMLSYSFGRPPCYCH